MTVTPQVIPTRYAGCHFRSRLEARWAVFFDTLGIRWEYEPEGFATSQGPYLPDFRIRVPDDGYPYWFEVKHEGFVQDDRHRVLCVETAMPLIVAAGMPRSYEDQLKGSRSSLVAMLWGDRLDGAVIPAGNIQPEKYPAAFVGPGHSSGSGWRCPHWDAIHKARAFGCSTFENTHIAIYGADDGHGHFVPWGSPAVDRAYAAARSARFEHGQSGAS